jgi:putative ABC transport system permease protein
METVWRDLRIAMRTLWLQRGFAAAVVIIAALGIGANSAVFSVINAVLFRNLPYQEPARLTFLYDKQSANGQVRGLVSPGDFYAWQQQQHSFSEIVAFTEGLFNLTGNGEPERLWGIYSSPQLFSTLGVQPLIGNNFNKDNNATPAAIISYGLWQRRFGGSAEIIGKTITIEGNARNIIGVMPANFQFPAKKFDIWVTRLNCLPIAATIFLPSSAA